MKSTKEHTARFHSFKIYYETRVFFPVQKQNTGNLTTFDRQDFSSYHIRPLIYLDDRDACYTFSARRGKESSIVKGSRKFTHRIRFYDRLQKLLFEGRINTPHDLPSLC